MLYMVMQCSDSYGVVTYPMAHSWYCVAHSSAVSAFHELVFPTLVDSTTQLVLRCRINSGTCKVPLLGSTYPAKLRFYSKTKWYIYMLW